MPGVEAINNQSIYFSATQAAAQQQAKEADKKKKTGNASKTSFINSLKKSEEEFELQSQGLPPELAGMDTEEAVVFLKDRLDIAGDRLKESQTPEQIQNYRNALGDFIRYVSRNNYEVITKRRPGFNRRTGKPATYVQIRVINEKLEQLTSDLLYNHSQQINILARLEEINGLIVDLLAS